MGASFGVMYEIGWLPRGTLEVSTVLNFFAHTSRHMRHELANQALQL